MPRISWNEIQDRAAIAEQWDGDWPPGVNLPNLYDPLTMPPALAKAHQALDRAVDRLYRKDPFETDADRVALLFERYGELVG